MLVEAQGRSRITRKARGGHGGRSIWELDELKAMDLGKDWEATIRAIEESQTTRKMIRLEEAKKAG